MNYHSKLQSWKDYFIENESKLTEFKLSNIELSLMCYSLSFFWYHIEPLADTGVCFELMHYKGLKRIVGKKLKASQKDNDKGHYLAVEFI